MSGGNPNHDRRTGEFARGSSEGLNLSHTAGNRINSMTKERFADVVNNENFSTVTAANPGKTLSTEENRKLMAAFYDELNERGVQYMPTVGKYIFGDPSAKPEPSVMILHTAHFGPKQVEELGSRYKQESVMHSIKGHAHIFYTNAPLGQPDKANWKGKVRYSVGDPNKPHAVLDSSATDAYTGHQGNKFSYDFGDFDAPPVTEQTQGSKLNQSFNKGKQS